MHTKYAMVLSGGGANGAWQVGVLNAYKIAIEENHPIGEPDIIFGTSVGALNGSRLCEYPIGSFPEAVAHLHEDWCAIEGNRSIYKPHLFGLIPSAILMFLFKNKLGLNSTKPLREFITKNLDVQRLRSSNRSFYCNAVVLNKQGQQEWFSSDDTHMIDGIMASAAYPVFFDPIKIGDKYYTDGGIRAQSSIGKAISMGAERIDVISCATGIQYLSNTPKSFDLLLRNVNIMLDEIDQDDFKQAMLINKLVEAGAPIAKERGWRVVEINVLKPNLPLGDSLDFSPDKNSVLMAIGREHGLKFIKSVLDKHSM